MSQDLFCQSWGTIVRPRYTGLIHRRVLELTLFEVFQSRIERTKSRPRKAVTLLGPRPSVMQHFLVFLFRLFLYIVKQTQKTIRFKNIFQPSLHQFNSLKIDLKCLFFLSFVPDPNSSRARHGPELLE